MIRNLILALGALAIVFWIGFAYSVNKDARRRSRNLGFVLGATALGLVPVVGPLLYLLFRPAETRADVRARDAELAALETLLLGGTAPTCPECSAPVGADYLVCPVCVTRLRVPCAECNSALDPLWQMCPHCATPVAADVDLDVALTREVHAVPELDLVRESEVRV